MYLAILCLISLTVSAVHARARPLPKLRYRPPKWVKLEPIKIMKNSEEATQIYRKFDSIVHFQDPKTPKNDLESLFGKNDVVYLTKENVQHPNNLLNIVEQVLDEESPVEDQGSRNVMDVLLGLKRGLRRQGGVPLKLAYEFNELVAK